MAGELQAAVAEAVAGFGRRDLPAVKNELVTTTAGRSGGITPFGSAPSPGRTDFAELELGKLNEPRPQARKDMVKTSMVLHNRLGLIKALFEGTSRHAIAGGLSPSSATGDRDHDMRADDYFGEVVESRRFDLRRELDFYSMQGATCLGMFVGGDCGAVLDRDENNNPLAKLVPTDRIGNGQMFEMPPSSGWVDGIRRGPIDEEPLMYRVLNQSIMGRPQGWTDYGPNQFLHIGKFDRIGINRPLPWMHHGKEASINILDLTAIETASAKLNAIFAAAITTPTGDVPQGIEAMSFARPENVQTTDSSGETTTETRQRNYVHLSGGGMVPVMAEGEKMEFFKNDRPSMTFAGFIDWLVNDIAWGFGLPPSFVWAVSGLSGPNARLVIEQADWFFKSIQRILIDRFCQPIWDGVIKDGMHRKKIPFPKSGVNIGRVKWQGPKSMTIDKGRDGKLILDQIKGGTAARSEWHEANGKHGRKERFRIMDELAEDLGYCRENNIPPALYFGPEAFSSAPAVPAAAGPSPSNALDDYDVNRIEEAVVTMMAGQVRGRM